MSGETFVSEVKLLQELGFKNVGLVYSIGIARATTNLKLSILLKVVKDLNEADYTEEQLMLLSSILSKGKVGEARALIASFKDKQQDQVEELRRNSQSELVKDLIEKNAAFTEEIEIDGKVFAKNPNTGEVLSPENAAKLLKQSQEALALVELEKRPRTDDFLASRLQATVVVEYSNLLGPDDCELVCDICKLPIPEDDLLPLDKCGHLLHSACILNNIMEQITTLKFPVSCPLSNCLDEISMLDLRERLSREQMDLFEKNTFELYIQQIGDGLTCCPNLQCRFVFDWSGEGPEFICPLCSMHYCLKCKVDWHKGLTCEQFRLRSEPSQVEVAYESLAKGARFKQCVYCLTSVEKPLGSNIMECRCGSRFCFKCGEAPGNCRCKKRSNPPKIFSGVSSFFRRMTG